MLWTLNVSRATLQFCSQQLLNVCTVIAQLCHCPQAFVEHQTLIEHDTSTVVGTHGKMELCGIGLLMVPLCHSEQ